MNIKVNNKIIKEICGDISFKRGESFYRGNKVVFETDEPDYCKAVVSGTEKFYVSIEKDGTGFRSTCSCPKLSSFQKDCQHIAAVLIAIYEKQKNGLESISSATSDVTAGLISLFDQKPRRTSGHQLHFEKRQVLDVEMVIRPIEVENHQYLFGIELSVQQLPIVNIRKFLEDVRKGHRSVLSLSFTYDPEVHCFISETDEIIRLLIEIMRDDKHDEQSLELLLIPPSNWSKLLPYFTSVPFISVVYYDHHYFGFQLTDDYLPLKFILEENQNRYLLKMVGIQELFIMESYRTVLAAGKFFQLSIEDINRLIELKGLLEKTGKNYLPISSEQINLFLEKVVPGLRKLGDVQISGSITKRFMKTPLTAKLYLDRVRNKLLAGLEFHYDNIMLNPLEEKHDMVGSIIIRDDEKEEEILELMDSSGFTKTDGGYFMHNEEAEYEFLYHIVPKLQKLVQIYATTAVRNRIIKKDMFPKIRVKIKKERTNWLEFKFEMNDIPEQQIRDLLKALEEKRKYYRLRNGSLLSLETREFEEIQRFLKAVPIQDDNYEAELNMPILQGLSLIEESEVFEYEESFRQFLDRIKDPSKMQYEIPESIKPILRDYQQYGFKWMKTLASLGFGGILADDMGLGKTLQSITFLLSELPDIRVKKQPALVVCPSSLTYNWLNEFMKFAPEIEAVVIDGNKADREDLLKEVTSIDVIITSYPLLRRDLKWYEKQKFHTVFFDEAQAFKNPITQTARAVKRIQANHRFALTGTPVENSLEELWSIFHVVFPELFKGLKEYSNLTRKTIARRIQPFLLRRLKSDVVKELPEKMELIERVELLPDQKKLYAAYLAKLREDTLKNLDKDTIRKNRIKILAGLTRLRQICCHPALFVDGYKGKSAKFNQLMQIMDEAKLSGRRVLIFSQFTQMLNLIGRELTYKGMPFFYLDGQTPSSERIEICNQFNKGERDIFLISLKAGGTGLNLTGADTVILYDIWWNPAVEEQAADRAHRIGQKNVVQVIKLITKGTIEEKMNELQDKKRSLIEEIIDSDEKSISSLTEEDIKEILMLPTV